MCLTEVDGCACEVKDFNNRLIAVGTVRTAGDTLEVRDLAAQMPILPLDSMIKLFIHKSCAGTVVLAGQVYISNRSFLRLAEVKSLATVERRRFFRQAIDHSAVLLCPAEGDGQDQDVGAAPEMLPVRVKDISLCGLLLESRRELAVGSRMQICMTLHENRLETMDLIVRREAGSNGKKRRYGCELVDLSSLTEQRLCAFIMRQQQEQIRQSRGL